MHFPIYTNHEATRNGGRDRTTYEFWKDTQPLSMLPKFVLDIASFRNCSALKSKIKQNFDIFTPPP